MLSPNLVLGFILATLFGAVFHLIFGGDARRLALFLLSGWLGFGVGHVLGVVFEIDVLSIGSLRVLPAVIGGGDALHRPCAQLSTVTTVSAVSKPLTLRKAYDNSPQEEKRRWTITRIAMVAGGVLAGLIVLLFIITFILALNDVQGLAELTEAVRDVFIIIIAVQLIAIVFALVVLVAQVAGLVNLLQTEIKPVLENLQQTLTMTRGTVKFVGDNVAQPVIKAGGFFAGLAVFVRQLGGIRKAIRRSEGAKMARKTRQQEKPIHEGAAFSGFLWGLIFGGIAALLRGPRLNRSTLPDQLNSVGLEMRGRVEAIAPADPVTRGIAEGKAAARRRLEETGRTPEVP